MASSWSRSVTRQGSELDSEPILNSRRLSAVVLFTLMCGWNNGVKQCAKLYCTLLDVWFLIFLAIMLVSSALSAVIRFLPSFCAACHMHSFSLWDAHMILFVADRSLDVWHWVLLAPVQDMVCNNLATSLAGGPSSFGGCGSFGNLGLT